MNLVQQKRTQQIRMMQRMKIQEIQQLEIPVIRIFREMNSGTI